MERLLRLPPFFVGAASFGAMAEFDGGPAEPLLFQSNICVSGFTVDGV